jgi:methionyl-tRNA synthetase
MAKKFYVTTSIAYTNAPPHIGFSLELVQADVLARYHKNLGEEVFFLTGTDEHGQKVLRAAEECKKKPEEFCNELSAKFKELKKILNLSNDDFIRTTDQKRHWPTVKKVWLELKTNGDIYKKKYRGLYCVGCEAFIKEKDLVGGKCPNHQQKPEVVEEENYFFRLSKYSDKIKKAIEGDEIKIFPESRKNEILAFIDQGVEDISCSRLKEKLKWGIPVPGDESQTIYIWFEALLNYISALGFIENSTKFRKFWPADAHCVGKDIFRFHVLLWPAILLSLKLPLPKNILVHGFVTFNGQKMSKSLGNIVCPAELVKKYGTDPVRYFLLREISPTEDGDFTYEKFEERYNSDLANGVGNTVNRILTMAEKYWGGTIPKIDKNQTGLNAVGAYVSPRTGMEFNFRGTVEKKYKFLEYFFEKFLFNSALATIDNLIKQCDIYIDAYKLYKPSEVLENNKEKIDIALYNLLETLRHIAWMLLPFMPKTAEKVLNQLGLDLKKEKTKKSDEVKKWGGLEPGTKIKKAKPLFPRI